MSKGQFPYAQASSGGAARDEITKLLKRFGCERVGFMEDFEAGSVLLQFEHRGRQVQLKASAKGWAAGYLRENPHTHRMRKTKAQHDQAALAQGLIAVNSILRDWVKGQVTAIECGILEFDAAFMPYMLLPDGRRVIDHARDKNLLPAPKES
jgi:hypothetical protein